MSVAFSVYQFDIPLSVPYVLSFGTVTSFKTLYTVMEGEDRIGCGEITPLPGYNHETFDGAVTDMQGLCEMLAKGTPFKDAVFSLAASSPFSASGAACAAETWEQGVSSAFAPCAAVPLSAFCAGATPEEASANAGRLAEHGYGILKMKVGAMSPAEDAARLRAVSRVLKLGMLIRLDANQCYDYESALKMCRYLEDIEGIELFEQPFAPDAWLDHEQLAGATSIPLMLDESIWTVDDVRRAADCGAQLVKFKLCKHLGIQGSVEIISVARSLGLGVVYGNGVQSAVGNHLEARIHGAEGLTTASEGNGFLKMKESPVQHTLSCRNGMLFSDGISNWDTIWTGGKLVASVRNVVIS